MSAIGSIEPPTIIIQHTRPHIMISGKNNLCWVMSA